MSVMRCREPKPNVPLVCAIDYRGFRLIAISLMPVDGKKTLVYGSDDGGKIKQRKRKK